MKILSSILLLTVAISTFGGGSSTIHYKSSYRAFEKIVFFNDQGIVYRSKEKSAGFSFSMTDSSLNLIYFFIDGDSSNRHMLFANGKSLEIHLYSADSITSADKNNEFEFRKDQFWRFSSQMYMNNFMSMNMHAQEMDSVQWLTAVGKQDSIDRWRLNGLHNLLLSNPSSLAALSHVYTGVQNNWDIDFCREILPKMSASLNKYKEFQFCKQHLHQLEMEKLYKVGDTLVSINVIDSNSNQFIWQPSKGQKTLIMVWSIGCQPCREENKKLATYLSKLKQPPTFQILSLNEDRNITHWLAAAKSDGVTWPSYSLPNGHGDEFNVRMNVTSVPFNILLDEYGRIEHIGGSMNDWNIPFKR